MTIRAQLLILCQSTKLFKYLKVTELKTNKNILRDLQYNVKYKRISNIINAISNVEVVDIMISIPDAAVITKRLLSTCSNSRADVIFIIGDTEFTDVEKDSINEAVEAISVNRSEFPKKLADLIKEIEVKLMILTNYRLVCGVRNKTLIINHLPDLSEDACIKRITGTLLNTLDLILKSDNLNTSLLDNAGSPDDNSSDNDSSEQRKDKDEVENLDTETIEDSSQETLEYSFISPTSSVSSSESSSLRGDLVNRHIEWIPMISLEVALTILSDVATEGMNKNIKNTEIININDAYGRILCDDVKSDYNVPSFKTSKKHGYAVLVSDGKELRQVLDGENRFPPISLERGTCIWVNSGAPVPDEATAVVQEKDTKRVESLIDNKVYIEIMIQPQHGQNINPIGRDLKKGKMFLMKRTCIGPAELGLLAAAGCKEIMVAQHISIGVLSIGNNLQELGKSLKPGYVYDINRITLISLLKENGFSSLNFGIATNEIIHLLYKIYDALKQVDILVTTGCSNDKDLLKKLLYEYFEAEIHFGNVNIKPGKSTTFATCKYNNKLKYFMCLPGNPSSAFIAAQVFLLPFVRKMSNNIYAEPAVIPVFTDCPFILHHRPRITCAYLEWSDKDNRAKALSMGNLFNDRLCNMVGSNALLLLPNSNEEHKLFSGVSSVIGLLFDSPEKFNRPLPNLF